LEPIKKDHCTVKDLLNQFEKAKSSAGKERIVSKAITELKMCAVVQRKSFTRL